MTVANVTLGDRLRIERAVWTLNTLLQDLPGRARRSACRELRANLIASSAEGGAREAIRRLGSLRLLAAGYLDAQYGGRPKPRWVKGLFWALAIELAFLGISSFGFFAYQSGLIDARATPGTTYRWESFNGWAAAGEFTMLPDGFTSSLTIPLLPLLLYSLLGFVVGGRMWRMRLPRRERVTPELETASR